MLIRGYATDDKSQKSRSNVLRMYPRALLESQHVCRQSLSHTNKTPSADDDLSAAATNRSVRSHKSHVRQMLYESPEALFTHRWRSGMYHFVLPPAAQHLSRSMPFHLSQTSVSAFVRGPCRWNSPKTTQRCCSSRLMSPQLYCLGSQTFSGKRMRKKHF